MIYTGDSLQVMPTLAPESVDAIVTDPPYGLSFMGKEWDHGVPGREFWEQALRVAKPGAHLLAFGGTRTFHRLAVAIEDAGWEIRDCLQWIYAQGFPKSLNVGKAIDKAAGAEREVVGIKHRGTGRQFADGASGFAKGPVPITAPATDAAKQWHGWGTALKPSWEPIIMARKPLIGTVAENVQRHGTGAINIDACRVPCEAGDKPAFPAGEYTTATPVGGIRPELRQADPVPGGRWPANTLHDGSPEVLAGFPETISNVRASPDKDAPGATWSLGRSGITQRGHADSGSAARFFYCAKASKQDRDEGLDNTRIVKYNIPKGVLSCEESMALVESLQRVMSVDGLDAKWLTGENGASIMGLCRLDSLSTTLTAISKITPLKILNSLQPKITRESTVDANCEMENGGNLAVSAEKSSRLNQVITSVSLELAPGASLAVSQMLSTISAAANWKPLTNFHSTVKPTDLMRYLCRLVTPPGGIVLDPFFGSGSTGKAAKLEYFNFIGIEREAEYCEIARKRIDGTLANRKLNFQEARP
jgi:hypothetical protein